MTDCKLLSAMQKSKVLQLEASNYKFDTIVTIVFLFLVR